jgi:putative oxidoreductase
MNILQRLEYWGDHHHPKWLDIIRIALGIYLLLKGVEFLNNLGVVMGMLGDNMSFGHFTVLLLGHYIIFAHILGGFFLVLGLLTRFACLIQVPVLLGAIIFSGQLLRPFSETAIAVLVLLLLIYFMIVGNGPWSFEAVAQRERKSKNQHE